MSKTVVVAQVSNNAKWEQNLNQRLVSKNTKSPNPFGKLPRILGIHKNMTQFLTSLLSCLCCKWEYGEVQTTKKYRPYSVSTAKFKPEFQTWNFQFNRNGSRLCTAIRPYASHTIDFTIERWMKSCNIIGLSIQFNVEPFASFKFIPVVKSDLQ